jgi:hypothetical protein
MITSFDRVRIEERRGTALLMLEARFGPLPTEIRQRLEALSLEQLRQLLLQFVYAQSLNELFPAQGSSPAN